MNYETLRGNKERKKAMPYRHFSYLESNYKTMNIECKSTAY